MTAGSPCGLVSEQPHSDFLPFDACPSESLDNLPGGFFLYIYQGESLLDLDRSDHARRHTCFIGNGSDEISRPDPRRTTGSDIHTYGSGRPTTASRSTSWRARTVPLLGSGTVCGT